MNLCVKRNEVAADVLRKTVPFPGFQIYRKAVVFVIMERTQPGQVIAAYVRLFHICPIFRFVVYQAVNVNVLRSHIKPCFL